MYLFKLKSTNNVKYLLYSLVTIFYLLLSVNTYAQDNTDLCDGTNILVRYDKSDDYDIACQSVNEIIATAKKIGLQYELDIKISFVNKLITNVTGKSLAIFKPETMEIQVLSFDTCKKLYSNGFVLGQKLDLELYKSIIVHELAHALLWKNKGENVIARELHEYFAYTIQLSLLSETHREYIISASNVPAFTNRSEMSEEYYLLNPTRFAVKSYLHFLNKENGWTFLKTILKQ